MLEALFRFISCTKNFDRSNVNDVSLREKQRGIREEEQIKAIKVIGNFACIFIVQ